MFVSSPVRMRRLSREVFSQILLSRNERMNSNRYVIFTEHTGQGPQRWKRLDTYVPNLRQRPTQPHLEAAGMTVTVARNAWIGTSAGRVRTLHRARRLHFHLRRWPCPGREVGGLTSKRKRKLCDENRDVTSGNSTYMVFEIVVVLFILAGVFKTQTIEE